MAEPMIMQTMPYDSPGTLIYRYQRSSKIPVGSLTMGAPNRGSDWGFWFRETVLEL